VLAIVSSKAWKQLLTKGRVGKERKQLAVLGLVGQAPTPEGRNGARLVNKGVNGAGGLEVACAVATWTGMLLQRGSQGWGCTKEETNAWELDVMAIVKHLTW